MKVPYNYLPMQFLNHDAIIAEWEKLILSTEFTLGSYVENFEKEFAKFIGCKHVIGTNTGTDALILALKALGIGPGDEVISVPTTFFATIGAIIAVGARPVFVDIDDRYQINAHLIPAAISSKTKAILPVHWGGAAPDMKAIMNLANSHGLKVIEDACMAPGGRINNQRSGTFGHVNAWSMHPLKPLNVMGDGGMVSTDNDDLAEWMRMYRNHGMINRDHNSIWGVNMRLQPLQAIVASYILKTVDETVKARNKNAQMLDDGLKTLAPFVKIPPRPKCYRDTFSLYMVRFEKRDELVKYLNELGIEVKIHYPIPLHLQKAAKPLGYKEGDFPVSEAYAKEVLTIPAHQFITPEQIEYILEHIRDFYIKNPSFYIEKIRQ
ncbi:MAG: DegT/DnrJ/EryC1/StrS family aminotransferase [Ignavibacteriales bacterium]|nr:DegT/DnrJ/EryC1/StrS family aminotransferase [Ignavibacteriales bacterium]